MLRTNRAQIIGSTGQILCNTQGGPVADSASACNSATATTIALKISDYVVMKAGFGADLCAKKVMLIKNCERSVAPSVIVPAATVHAMKKSGAAAKAARNGCAYLGRHIENVKSFGVPVSSADLWRNHDNAWATLGSDGGIDPAQRSR